MDKISKYLIEYISFLNGEKEEFFEEKVNNIYRKK